MTPELETVLEQAKKLPVGERRELVELLSKYDDEVQNEPGEVSAALAIVEETFGSISGLDRQTLIRLAEDEEFCGY